MPGQTKDESAGVLLTKWEDSSSMGTDYRYRWSVTIANGSATISSQCQLRIQNPGPMTEKKWEDCGESQPAARTEMAKQIAESISR